MYHIFLKRREVGMIPVNALLAALNILRLGEFVKSGRVPWRALLSRLIQRSKLDPSGN